MDKTKNQEGPLAKVTRIYKFLDAKYGLENIRKRRVKISEIRDPNDPFEFIPFDLSNPELRQVFLDSRDEMNRRGMISFSLDWQHTLLWSHYADKHRGICLGFDTDRSFSGSDSHFLKVEYEPERLQFRSPRHFDEIVPSAAKLLNTKSSNWAYEKEVRTFFARDEEENGLYFAKFDEHLKLSRVIMGHSCSVERGQILAALTSYDHEITVTQARLSYTKYEVEIDHEKLVHPLSALTDPAG